MVSRETPSRSARSVSVKPNSQPRKARRRRASRTSSDSCRASGKGSAMIVSSVEATAKFQRGISGHLSCRGNISVDTKKKELVGNFKPSGRAWCREPANVDDHSFPSQAEGVATPFGVYDVTKNRGLVAVGMSHNRLFPK